MREFIIEVFANHTRIVVFLHVASAVLLVGALFVTRFLIVPVLDTIKKEEIRYETYLGFIKYFLCLVLFLMLIIIFGSIFMNIGFGFKFGDQTTYIMVHVKELLWTIMAGNFIFMYIKYKSAKKAINNNLLVEVYENIVLITKYLTSINLALGFICVYFGIVIRGF